MRDDVLVEGPVFQRHAHQARRVLVGMKRHLEIKAVEHRPDFRREMFADILRILPARKQVREDRPAVFAVEQEVKRNFPGRHRVRPSFMKKSAGCPLIAAIAAQRGWRCGPLVFPSAARVASGRCAGCAWLLPPVPRNGPSRKAIRPRGW